MTRLRLAVVLFALGLVFAGRAEAKHVRFLGAHPIAPKLGGGFCYIEAPHLHAYAPDHAPLYQQVGDQWVFTGDPTPFGYEGERHPFYGHHPVVTVGTEPVYCYLDGPHVHPFAAPDGAEYKVKGGVAFYVGPFGPTYAKLKPHRVKAINAEYRPFATFRPTIEVEPPPEWHGEVWVPGPPGVPGVVVQAPGVTVAPPSVTVSAPGVMVAAPAPHVVVHAPAPQHVVVSPPGVYVGAPGVVVGAPGVYVGSPGVVVGAPGVVVAPGRKHDNGRHLGWGKPEKHGHGGHDH